MVEVIKVRETARPALARAPQKAGQGSPSALKAPSAIPNSISIEKNAYYLWEKEGRPENKALEFWLRAEKEFLSNLKTKT